MNKKNRLIGFFILLILITLLLSSAVYADTNILNRKGEGSSDFDKSNNYNGVYNNFCIDDTRTYAWATSSAWWHDVQRNQKVIYTSYSNESGEVPPSIGYALWYLQKTGHLQEAYSSQDNIYWQALQTIIYNSKAKYNENLCINAVAGSFGTEVEKWSDIYAKCYYEIFQNLNGGSIFDAISSEKELAVNVDQEEKTIVVGPYYLELRVNASLESKKYLYEQLSRERDGSIKDQTAFATFDKIKNMNCDEGEKPIFINKNGQEINFPNFVAREPFYIKFKPANEGFITDVAKRNEEYKKKPVISIDYINGFTGDIIKFEESRNIFEDLYVNPIAPDVSINNKFDPGETRLLSQNENEAWYEREYRVNVKVIFHAYYAATSGFSPVDGRTHRYHIT